MSRSKVHTLQDVKEQEEEKLILSSSQYKKLLKTISQYETELIQAEESNDKNEIVIIHLKEKCRKLYELAKSYKDALQDKDKIESANIAYMKKMAETANKITEEVSNKKTSKYSKKSKEELEKLALQDLGDFFNNEVNIDNL
jgi:hypothetical protein